MKKSTLMFIPIVFLLSACTWVEPTLMGREVKLVDQSDKTLATCDELGSLTTMVKHKIGSFDRSKEKVDAELTTLAQNEAVEMGGDAIAAEGPSQNGRRTFSVYKCRQ